MPDGHKHIRDRTERKFRAALERLQKNAGRHPKHIGCSVAISVAAVVREAELGRSTIYRFPHLIEEVNRVRNKPRAVSAPSKRAERRLRQVDTVKNLLRQVHELLDRNLELTLLLAKLDPGFEKKIVAFDRSSRAVARERS